MAAERLSMRKIKEILRLKTHGLSNRQIAASIKVSHSSVAEYLRRAEGAGLKWPLPEELDDANLEALLFKEQEVRPNSRAEPDYNYLHRELRKKGVTLRLLWEECQNTNPDGYCYSQFCHIYRNWNGHIEPSLRQVHRAGEKMFVDYAGQTVPVVDPKTGEVQEAQIFVAVLGASNYTFAQATPTQELHFFISSHVSAFSFFGGVPRIVVPDNLKSGVTKPCRYEPDINPTYLDMALHYGIAVIPARPGRPKDKPKAESAVQVVEQWILASLRNHTFFSLTELNQAIAQLLVKLNEKPFQKLEGSRKELFEELEKLALLPLPQKPYQFAIWKKARVNIDYHIEAEGHYYNVPHQLIKKQVDVRLSPSTVEVLFKGRRITSHVRSFKKGGFTTKDEHRPKAHRKYLEWTPSRIISWAGKTGAATKELVSAILESKPHPEQGYRSCLGILRLSKRYGADRLEAACRRATATGATSYRSLNSILKNGLDKVPIEEPSTATRTEHENIRGSTYYH